MPTELRIEAVSESRFESLLSLIEEYQRFYQRTPDRNKNRKFFSQLMDRSQSMGIQFIALRNDALVGFATLYFVPSSLAVSVVCWLNDLYTIPEERGRGVGRALIEYSVRYARDRGFSGLNWQTQSSNAAALRLYESLGATKSEWIEFNLRL